MLKTKKQIYKSYAVEVLNDYAEIVEGIPQIIKDAGYRVEYVARRLKMPRSSFYAKRKTKSFSLSEVREIVGMMHESDEIEDRYLSEHAKIRMADKTNVSRDEVMKALMKE
jgi:hypothetical protein